MIKDDELKKYLLAIITHYGVLEQLKYLQSEVFELNEAVITNQYSCTKSVCDIAEEIADVLVMLNQLKIYHEIPDDKIEEIMKLKIERQLVRITNEFNNIKK